MKPLRLLPALVLAAFIANGCGGGGNSGPSTRPTATPSATPSGTPSGTPTSTATPTSLPTASLRGQIGFVSLREGNSDIYLVDAQGNNVRPFGAINSSSEERAPSLSRDGAFIAWSSNRPTGNATANTEIYFANADGTNLRQYTNDMGSFPPSDESPVISPDGTKIAWTTTRGGNFNIAVMDSNGDNQVTLTGNNPGEDSQPAWTSDSQSIAFFSDRANSRGLYIMNADGTSQRPLLAGVPGDTTFYAPKFSPNGNLLAVSVQAPGGTSISLRNPDGTPAATQFSPSGGPANRNFASFSPDGTHLIYTGFDSAGSEQIYSANLDGSDERALTSVGRNFEAMFGG